MKRITTDKNKTLEALFSLKGKRGIVTGASSWLNRMPLHRFGHPGELATMVLFFVSPAASYVTGHDFAVDGGALAFGF